jgi:hypothetical protein
MGIEKVKRRDGGQWKFNVILTRDRGVVNLASDHSLPVTRQIEGCANFYDGERILRAHHEEGDNPKIEC